MASTPEPPPAEVGLRPSSHTEQTPPGTGARRGLGRTLGSRCCGLSRAGRPSLGTFGIGVSHLRAGPRHGGREGPVTFLPPGARVPDVPLHWPLLGTDACSELWPDSSSLGSSRSPARGTWGRARSYYQSTQLRSSERKDPLFILRMQPCLHSCCCQGPVSLPWERRCHGPLSRPSPQHPGSVLWGDSSHMGQPR